MYEIYFHDASCSKAQSDVCNCEILIVTVLFGSKNLGLETFLFFFSNLYLLGHLNIVIDIEIFAQHYVLGLITLMFMLISFSAFLSC